MGMIVSSNFSPALVFHRHHWPCDLGRAGHPCIDHFHRLQLGTPQEGWAENGWGVKWVRTGGTSCDSGLEPLRPWLLAGSTQRELRDWGVWVNMHSLMLRCVVKIRGIWGPKMPKGSPGKLSPKQIKAYQYPSKTHTVALRDSWKPMVSGLPQRGPWASQLSTLRAGSTADQLDEWVTGCRRCPGGPKWCFFFFGCFTSSTAEGGGGSFKIGNRFRRGWLLWIMDGSIYISLSLSLSNLI